MRSNSIAMDSIFLNISSYSFIHCPSNFLLYIINNVTSSFITLAGHHPRFLQLTIFIFHSRHIHHIRSNLHQAMILFRRSNFNIQRVLFRILSIASIHASRHMSKLIKVARRNGPTQSRATHSPHLQIKLFIQVSTKRFACRRVLNVINILVLIRRSMARPIPVMFTRLQTNLRRFRNTRSRVIRISYINRHRAVLMFNMSSNSRFISITNTRLMSTLSQSMVTIHFFRLIFPKGRHILTIKCLTRRRT